VNKIMKYFIDEYPESIKFEVNEYGSVLVLDVRDVCGLINVFVSYNKTTKSYWYMITCHQYSISGITNNHESITREYVNIIVDSVLDPDITGA
jgi:hypothetical protein